MVVQYIFVFACFLIDGIIETCFPVNFAMNSVYFVSCFGVCALILTIRKMDFIDALILSILSGMFYDFFFTNSFLVYIFIFVLLCFIVKAWQKHVGESLLESIILAICSLFTMQLITYALMWFSGDTRVSFNSWIYNRMFLTLVVNVGFVFILHFLTNLRDDYIRMRDLKIRKDEKLSTRLLRR
ncbi:rod shape-determining protein MreD [Breznakia blatticola]|uniref:Rod shape-determining protein MreD n=1 Tax=Breznakia blatticola TaxID=1754012 RepID=A0A4R7ZGG8_9FIRM|nr:hypothetical protein [Breznakia blatticola]TDW16136.1 rod shape-determining protein MreD [Breznakia blatticola]